MVLKKAGESLDKLSILLASYEGLSCMEALLLLLLLLLY
jgi:hypothetical protein